MSGSFYASLLGFLTSPWQAGPSGLLLTLLLARYGIDSMACFDAKPGTIKAGQADGLQPRTLEVFKSLGIADEILNDGCHMSEVAFWNSKPIPLTNGNGTIKNPGIERTSFVPDVNVAARYQHEVTIHQGRIERILKENLDQYGGQDTIRFSHRFTGFKFDEVQCPEYPILLAVEAIEPDGSITQKSFRTKYLVGADGAHSLVRKDMGLRLEGETTDHIWGVVDFVADTDFPDIRKRCAIHSSTGSIMVIPRERIASGEYLTRLYVQIADTPEPDLPCDDKLSKAKLREKRAAVTLDYILNQGSKVLAPYAIRVKEGTAVDWWAAYQIGQRMTPKSSINDRDGVNRVFIVGDGE
jgi:phenol 2-monooxygenase (NADPH)